jgi:hypothetical protein
MQNRGVGLNRHVPGMVGQEPARKQREGGQVPEPRASEVGKNGVEPLNWFVVASCNDDR